MPLTVIITDIVAAEQSLHSWRGCPVATFKNNKTQRRYFKYQNNAIIFIHRNNEKELILQIHRRISPRGLRFRFVRTAEA